jgi:hypothetical protein
MKKGRRMVMKTNKFFSKKYVLNVLFLLCFTFAFTFFTHANAKAATAPAQVKGLVQTDASDDSVRLQWNSLGDGIRYEIKYATSVDGTYTSYDTIGITDYFIDGLSAGSTYYVKIHAIVPDGSVLQVQDSDALEVVTEPATAPTKVWQSNSTTSSITISWTQVTGANNYKVQYVPTSDRNSTPKEVNTSDTSITVSNISPDNEYIFMVYPERKNAKYNASCGNYQYCYGKMTPSKVTGLTIPYYWEYSKAVNLNWSSNGKPDGYQIQLNCDKKAIKTYNTTSSYAGVELYKITTNKFFKARVRAYITVNGQKVYGDYSDWFYFSQQPKVSLQSNPNGMNVGWVKVTGATDYTVYASTKKNSGYTKVGTTKNTNMLVKKIGKTKLKSGKTYYFYAVANKKAGSTTYTGKATYCWSLKYRK